jgi:putative DNA primase/helicase
VAIAAILTAVLRAAFDVAPMFIFLAHAAGTGKSYLVNVISNIVRGRPCPVITVSRSTEEMEKRLGALLLEVPPIISLDNCTLDLEGELLCQVTEQPLVKVRILGKSETPECEWRGTLFATGNNITLKGDMTRRGLTSNLDAGVELPETRRFDFDPVARVLSDRGTYIAAAIVIARAYLVSGEEAKCPPLGSYGGWSKFVREPLVWLGEADPVRSLEQARANDPERNAARALIEQWAKHLKVGEGYGAGDVIECARETRPAAVMGSMVPAYEHVRPEFYHLLLEKCSGPRGGIDPKPLGKWLSRMKGQVHDGFRIVAASVSSSHGNRWALEKVGRTEDGGTGVKGG